MAITIDDNFSKTVEAVRKRKNISKRWLYLKLNMTPQTFEDRLAKNDWRLDEIKEVAKLLGI